MEYRREIDGLRAIAVVPVILFHAGFGAFQGGFVGVDVFFVISGYLIASIIARELDAGRFSLAEFYSRRARRILPALLFITSCCVPFAWAWLLPWEFAEFGQSLAAAALSVSNLFFWRNTGYFAPDADQQPLLHTWSLGVEEQFYLLFPLFLLVAWRIGRRNLALLIGLGALASLAVAEWGAHYHPSANFYLLPTRAWELGIGALLALYLKGRPPTRSRLNGVGAALGLILVALSVVALDSDTPFPGLAALAPTAGAGLIILCGARDTLVGRLLSLPVLVGLGLISYSAYLWHLPLMVFAETRPMMDLPPLALLVPGLASLPLAYLTWRFVEQPFRKRGVFSRRRIFTLSGSGVFAVAVVGLFISASDGFPSRLSPEAFARAQSDLSLEYVYRGCDGRPPALGLCRWGSDQAPETTLLWGDSHAGALMPAIEVAFASEGGAGWLVSDSGCAPVIGVRRTGATGRACQEWNEGVLEWIQERASSLRTVILAARWPLLATGQRAPGEIGSLAPLTLAEDPALGSPSPTSDAELFELGLSMTVARLRDEGLQVILLGGVPEIGWNVPRALVSRAWRGTSLPSVPTLDDVELRHAEADAVLAGVTDGSNVRLIPLAPILCRTRCRVEEAAQPLYVDDDHLSSYATRYVVGPELASVLSR